MVARFRGTQLDRRDIKNFGGFNGNFASLFPGAFQAVQSDLGLTYGGTPLAAGTTPPVATLSGVLATVPIPILFKPSTPGVIGSGAVFSAYADGIGVTPFQVGITPVGAGVPVALGGPAAGLSIAWAAGTSNADNTWTATAAALSDQTANARNYSQATASAQPTITVGLNGKPGLLFNGTTQFMRSTWTTPDPSVTPFLYFLVFRHLAWAVNNAIVSDGAHTSLAQRTVTPNVQMALSAFGNQAALALNSWGVGEASLTNSTADYVRMGAAAAVTGVSSGSGAGSGSVDIAHTALFAQFTNMEFLALVVAPLQSTAAARAVIPALYGGSVLV